MKKKLFIIGTMLWCLFALPSFGQVDDDDLGPIAQRIQSVKVAFMTDKLKLSPEESQKFWPIYNQMTQEEKNTREKYRSKKDLLSMTDAEAEQFIQSHFQMEQELLNLKKDYYKRLESALPVRKIAMLDWVEREFNKEILKQLRQYQMLNRQRQGNRND